MNSTFTDNTAPRHAGVLNIDDSTVTILESSFHNNSGRLNGGVVSSRASPITLIVMESSFTDNQSGEDGGVIHAGRDGSLVDVKNSNFAFNNATQRGGVVAIVGRDSKLNINETVIFNNMATLGGVISTCNSVVIQSLKNLLSWKTLPASFSAPYMMAMYVALVMK